MDKRIYVLNARRYAKIARNRRLLAFLLTSAMTISVIVMVVLGSNLIATCNLPPLHESRVPVNSPHQTQIRRPHYHVYYAKVHKTGSMTMYTVLAEVCRSHDLLPLLPVSYWINEAPPFVEKQLSLPNASQKFDMLFAHVTYTPSILKYLHADTFTFTTLREPFSQFVSSFHYYRSRRKFTYLTKVTGDNPLAEFLKNPSKYEIKGFDSYTNNRQSMDLGFDMSHPFDDVEYINEFIKLTEKRFDLVLMTPDFIDESLVILKRSLHWSTQDILYFRKNEGPKKDRNENFHDAEYIKLHAKFSQADIKLYDHFLTRFKEKMTREIGLEDEVSEFRIILQKVKVYCSSGASSKTSLDIPSGRWTDPIHLLPYKCSWLQLSEFQFTDYLKDRQNAVLSTDPLTLHEPTEDQLNLMLKQAYETKWTQELDRPWVKTN